MQSKNQENTLDFQTMPQARSLTSCRTMLRSLFRFIDPIYHMENTSHLCGVRLLTPSVGMSLWFYMGAKRKAAISVPTRRHPVFGNSRASRSLSTTSSGSEPSRETLRSERNGSGCQNQWCHFGVHPAPPILVYFGGDWDVHWGYDL